MTERKVGAPSGSRSALWVLGLGTFAIGTDAFIVAGVLVEITRTFRVSIPLGGQLISLFALTYAIFSPLVASFSSRWSRRTTLLAAIFVFSISNLLSGLAPSFELLAVTRVFAAAAAATYTPQAIAAVSDLVPAHKKGQALSIVYGGMTLAIALGVPLGTLVGQTIGWRDTFFIVVILGVVTFVSLARLLPNLPSPPPRRITERFAALNNARVLLIYLITFLTVLSEHTVYSYISIIFAETRWANFRILPIGLVCFGIGAVIGNFLAGNATDRFSARAVLLSAVIVQSISLLMVSFVYAWAVPSCVALFLWGVAGWMYLVPIQHRLLAVSSADGPLTISLNSSVLYLGIAGGGALGGVLVELHATDELGLVGCVIGLIALSIVPFGFGLGSSQPDREETQA